MRTLPLLLLALSLAAPLRAQERIAVVTEAGTPVIATEVLLAAGPADEDSTHAGVAYLAARSVTEPLRPLLDSLGAHLQVTPRKDAISFSLIAAPDAWEAVSRALLVALFRDPPRPEAIERERRAIEAELRGREANPADAMVRVTDAAFFGPEHPWGRATVGTLATVRRLEPAEVDAFLRRFFTPARTVAAVVGPIEEGAARAHLATYLEASGPIPFRVTPSRPQDSPVETDYNSITTWVSAVFPMSLGADEEALRLAAWLTREELSSRPEGHQVYDVRAEVIPRLGGGELRFQVVSPPQEAEAWAERVQETVRELVEVRMLDADWEAKLRRYRGERLHEFAAPEERAAVVARRILLGDGSEPLLPDLAGLTQARLRAAVDSLGRPTVVFLGPFLDADER